MNFAISDDQQQLLNAVDRFLDQRLPIEEVRRRDAARVELDPWPVGA